MYVNPNFKTKKELKEAVARGDKVLVFAPGMGSVPKTPIVSVEGPHYPQPHRWYARVEVQHLNFGDAIVRRVVS